MNVIVTIFQQTYYEYYNELVTVYCYVVNLSPGVTMRTGTVAKTTFFRISDHILIYMGYSVNRDEVLETNSYLIV